MVNDAAEGQLARDRIGIFGGWIGLTDTALNGTFVWVTGETVGYLDFQNGEPTETAGTEDCVWIRPEGLYWDDRPCNTLSARWLCECDGLAPSKAYCDTDRAATCGTCSTSCTAPATCSQQLCL